MEIARCLPESVAKQLLSYGIAWERVCELHLRAGSCPSVGYACGGKIKTLPLAYLSFAPEELRDILGRLCAGSVHVYDEGLLRGYFSPLTLPGVRIGCAGRLLCAGGVPQRLQQLTSLCIRLPHAVMPSAEVRGQLLAMIRGDDVAMDGAVSMVDKRPLFSTLFYAPPGEGKTTLLRCLIRALCAVGEAAEPMNCAVLDTSEELCGTEIADCTVDRFSGYPRGLAMALAVRAFAPKVLVCDEIGTDEEAEEILRAQACGIPLIATAHADTLRTLLRRPCFARLHENGVFARYVRIFRKTDGQFGFDAGMPA